VNVFSSATRSNAQGGGTLADDGTTGDDKSTTPDATRLTSRPSSSNLRRPTASTRPVAARPVPRAAAPAGAAVATTSGTTPAKPTLATPKPPPDLESEGFDRSEKLLFLGGAILVVIIAAYGAYALLSAGSGKSSNVSAGAANVTTTTAAVTTTTDGDTTPSSSETTVTTEGTPDTTAGTPDTTAGGGGGPAPTVAPPVPTTLPPGVRPIVQVAPRSGDRLVIPRNSDINNVNPGVTAGKISILNGGASPGGYFVTFPLGTPEDRAAAARIRIVSGGSGTLSGGGTANIVLILEANPKDEAGNPLTPAQTGDTGRIIVRGLGPDITINYVVG
jgi:hypothetical protein